MKGINLNFFKKYKFYFICIFLIIISFMLINNYEYFSVSARRFDNTRKKLSRFKSTKKFSSLKSTPNEKRDKRQRKRTERKTQVLEDIEKNIAKQRKEFGVSNPLVPLSADRQLLKSKLEESIELRDIYKGYNYDIKKNSASGGIFNEKGLAGSNKRFLSSLRPLEKAFTAKQIIAKRKQHMVLRDALTGHRAEYLRSLGLKPDFKTHQQV